jgi:endonuclease/exonuclease/phosphatase family metal-dependent hydrolase
MKHKIIIIIATLLLVINSGIAQNPLEIMTFNVRYDEALFHKGEPRPNHWANRKLLQVELIKKYQPDVIGIQEPHLHQIQYVDEQLPAYSWFGVGRGDGKEKDEFNPKFYRNDILALVNSGTFWLSDTPDKVSRSWDASYDRICIWALFQNKKTKKQFYVFNTHFDSKGKDARVNSAKLINEKIETMAGDKPIFVTGDFNFQPESTPYSEMISQSLSDSRKVVENEPSGSEETFNNFRYGATHKHRIDFIFVNDKVDVKEYKVIDYSKDGVYPSDHFPVMVKLNLN